MGHVDERISQQFATWEQRGRGWQVWPEPVLPEPPFQEFSGYHLAPTPPVVDDGRHPSFLASLFDSLHQLVAPTPPVIVEEVVDPEPVASEHALEIEFIANIPAQLSLEEDALRALVDSLEACAGPIAFELFVKEGRVSVQLASSRQDAPTLQRQLTAFLPELSFVQTEGVVAEHWCEQGGIGFIVDFGLAHEFMLPLQTEHRLDPFVGLVAALGEVRRGEAAVFQVLFQPVRHPWAASVWRSLTDADGKMLFINQIPLIPGTKTKLDAPLFGVVVRAAAQAGDFERAADIVLNMARALRPFARPEGNQLIPLHNDQYPFELHETDLLLRQSRRSGMLLNREELLGFVHLPGDEVCSPQLHRQLSRTKAAPSSALSPTGLLLGVNDHDGRVKEVRLNADQRMRHTHIIGATGTGKSTLLFNLIRQDIESGQGLAVFDPHGDLVDKLLGIIPDHRIDDVVLLNGAEEEFFVSFNILSAHSDFEKNLLASDLVSVFRRLCSSWGDQMGSVLNNAILAFLESSQGGTLADLRRFLLDAEFQNRFLETVRDPDIVYYWRKAFPKLGGNKSIGPVLTRLDTFLSPKPIRYMVSQRANRLDFANILDSGKIFLVKLQVGLMGRENAFLIGSLLMAKFQQLAMSRARLNEADRRDFFVYLDEFQEFVTSSVTEILSGTRKYRLGLILAHQELHQLQRDSAVASAVLSNAQTRIVFRVGDSDARALEVGFDSFETKDIQRLGIGQALCRIEGSNGDFNLSVPWPEPVDADRAAVTRAKVIAASREKYATPRAEVEAELFGTQNEEPRLRETSAPPRRDKNPARTPPTPSEPIANPIPAAVAPTPEPPVDAVPSKQLERQHQLLKEKIESAAEKIGFEVVMEKLLQSGKRIDVVLEGQGVRIACEPSRTTSVEWEVGNVKKCFEEFFDHVAVISLTTDRLIKIRDQVLADLAPEQARRVRFFQPDEFITWLQRFAPVAKADQTDANVKKRDFDFEEFSEADRKRIEKEKLAVMTAFMERRREGKS